MSQLTECIFKMSELFSIFGSEVGDTVRWQEEHTTKLYSPDNAELLRFIWFPDGVVIVHQTIDAKAKNLEPINRVWGRYITPDKRVEVLQKNKIILEQRALFRQQESNSCAERSSCLKQQSLLF